MTASSNGDSILKEWRELSDEERKRVIPALLYSIAEWRVFSLAGPIHSMHWLKQLFDESGVPLY